MQRLKANKHGISVRVLSEPQRVRTMAIAVRLTTVKDNINYISRSVKAVKLGA